MSNFCIDCKYCHKVLFKFKAYDCHHDHYATSKYDYVTGEVERSYMSCDIARFDTDYCEYYEPSFWKKFKTKIFGV